MNTTRSTLLVGRTVVLTRGYAELFDLDTVTIYHVVDSRRCAGGGYAWKIVPAARYTEAGVPLFHADEAREVYADDVRVVGE